MSLIIGEHAKDPLLKIFDRHEKNLDCLISLRDCIENHSLRLPNVNSQSNYSFVKQQFISCYQNTNKEFSDFLTNSIYFNDINFYKNNPYFKLLNKVDFKSKDWKIDYEKIFKYELFVCGDNITTRSDLIVNSSLTYFNEDYLYPSLKLNNREWMSLHPNEIETMKTPIMCVKGKVLVLGLGLGYFPYMISNKEDVEEIVIIEMDKGIIDLFMRKILPLFPHKEKIHIVKAEAISYLNKVSDKEYDYIYADLWHDVGDGLPLYIEIKNRLKTFSYTRTFYWIEDSLITYFRFFVIKVLKDIYYCYDRDDYGEIENMIFNYLSNVTLNNKDDVNNLLCVKGLNQIINQKC